MLPLIPIFIGGVILGHILKTNNGDNNNSNSNTISTTYSNSESARPVMHITHTKNYYIQKNYKIKKFYKTNKHKNKKYFVKKRNNNFNYKTNTILNNKSIAGLLYARGYNSYQVSKILHYINKNRNGSRIDINLVK